MSLISWLFPCDQACPKLTFQLSPKYGIPEIEWARFTEFNLGRFGVDFTQGESYRLEYRNHHGETFEKALLTSCMKCKCFMNDRVDATCGDCEDDEIKPMVEGVYELKKAAVKEYKYGKCLVLTFLKSDKKPAATCVYNNNHFLGAVRNLQLVKSTSPRNLLQCTFLICSKK